MDQPFVLLSMPLTGLAPVVTYLAEHLVWNEGIVYLGEWGDRQRDREGRPDISVWSERKRSKIRVITGPAVDLESHKVAGAEQGRYVTVVRDPADHAVAQYSSLLGRGHDLPDFWTWYRDRRPNPIAKLLEPALGTGVVREMKRVLSQFWLATTTQTLNEDLPHLFEAIGVPGGFRWEDRPEFGVEESEEAESRKVDRAVLDGPELSADERLQVQEDHSMDSRLHEAVLRQRLRKRERYGWD